MAGRPGDDRRNDRGAAQLTAGLLIVASLVLAALICLALLSWFGRVL